MGNLVGQTENKTLNKRYGDAAGVTLQYVQTHLTGKRSLLKPATSKNALRGAIGAKQAA